MLSQLRAAFVRVAQGWRKGPSEAKRRQQQATRSRGRLSLEALEDRMALSTMGGVDATSAIQSMPALVNAEQQAVQQFALNVAGFLTAEAQLVNPISPPLASFLQSEAQLVLNVFDPAAASATGIHEYPFPGSSNIFPHPVTSVAVPTGIAAPGSTGIHIYPYPGAGNIFPHPYI